MLVYLDVFVGLWWLIFVWLGICCYSVGLLVVSVTCVCCCLCCVYWFLLVLFCFLWFVIIWVALLFGLSWFAVVWRISAACCLLMCLLWFALGFLFALYVGFDLWLLDCWFGAYIIGYLFVCCSSVCVCLCFLLFNFVCFGCFLGLVDCLV